MSDRTQVAQYRQREADDRTASSFAVTQARRQAMIETTAQREVAEVQGAMILARRFPRDQIQAIDRVIQMCTRKELAEASLYSYSRGGTEVTGPSIRLAEAIAQAWGNIQWGIRELEQRDDESTVEAYAWDLETNTRQSKTFQVRLERHTRQGSYKLVDPRDIYELTANNGARRVRACILGIIPGDVVEAAINQCEETLRAKADISPEAISKIAAAFKDLGVTKEQIENRCQCRLEAIRPAQIINLRKVYASIKDGMSDAEDWFAPVLPPDVEAEQRGRKVAEKKKDVPPNTNASKDAGGDGPHTASEGVTGNSPSGSSAGSSPPAGGPAGAETPRANVADPQTAGGNREPPPSPPAVEFWPADENGEPIEDENDVVVFRSAGSFASWFEGMLAASANPRALWQNNADSVEEIKASDPDAYKRMTLAMTAAITRRDEADEKARAAAAAEQAEEQKQVEETFPGDVDPGAAKVVQVPRTAGGKDDWQGYAKNCKAALEDCADEAAVTAWQNANLEIYSGRIIAVKVDQYVRDRLTAIRSGSLQLGDRVAEQKQAVDERQATWAEWDARIRREVEDHLTSTRDMTAWWTPHRAQLARYEKVDPEAARALRALLDEKFHSIPGAPPRPG